VRFAVQQLLVRAVVDDGPAKAAQRVSQEFPSCVDEPGCWRGTGRQGFFTPNYCGCVEVLPNRTGSQYAQTLGMTPGGGYVAPELACPVPALNVRLSGRQVRPKMTV
jgi:hypothetical protein